MRKLGNKMETFCFSGAAWLYHRARVQRGPSEAARCASTVNGQAALFLFRPVALEGSGQIVLHCGHRMTTFHRGGSASTMDSLASFFPSHCIRRGVAKVALDCARPTRGACDRALREHRRSSGSIPSSILRARRAPGCSRSSLDSSPPVT